MTKIIILGAWIFCFVMGYGLFLVMQSRERYRQHDEWHLNGHDRSHKDREAA